MNILFTCGSFSWGGLEMQTLKLAKTFKDKGHNVLLLVPKNSRLHENATAEHIKTKTLRWSNALTVVNIFKTKHIINTFQPQIIHTQLSHDLWILSPAISKKSKTHLVFTRRMASNVSKKDFLHTALYKKVDVVLCVSKFIADNMAKTTTVNSNNIKVHYNGLNLKRFTPELYDKDACRKELGIGKDAYVVGFLGRFTFMKGHSEFFEAGKMIQQRFAERDFQFLVAGGDSFGEEAFGQETREKGIDLLGKENIVFTGDITNTPQVLKAMDVLVFPSHEESFGNVLCEAGAMEIPVVASNSGGVPDIVIHNETGLLVEPKNSLGFAEAIAFYIQHPEIAKEHGKEARVFVSKMFEEEKQIQDLENIYTNLISENY